MKGELLGLGLLTLLACGGRKEAPPPVAEVVSSAHYTVSLEDGLPRHMAQPILDRLEGEHERITASLGITPDASVTVRVWRDERAFLAHMERELGTRFPGAGGYVTGPTEARVLHQAHAPQIALHECVHAHSLRSNPRFGNHPRWLWEAVAIFEAGEFIDPRTLPYLMADQFPTLQDLNALPGAEGRKTYEVGWLLAAFIRDRWGLQAYRDLIRTSGDLSGVLALTESGFHLEWESWVKAKYMNNQWPSKSLPEGNLSPDGAPVRHGGEAPEERRSRAAAGGWPGATRRAARSEVPLGLPDLRWPRPYSVLRMRSWPKALRSVPRLVRVASIQYA